MCSGLLFKHRGRVGQAASFGGGCWIGGPQKLQNDPQYYTSSVACCSSGCGESLLRALVSEKCGSQLLALNTADAQRREHTDDEDDDHCGATDTAAAAKVDPAPKLRKNVNSTCMSCRVRVDKPVLGVQSRQHQLQHESVPTHNPNALGLSLDLGHGDDSSGFRVGVAHVGGVGDHQPSGAASARSTTHVDSYRGRDEIERKVWVSEANDGAEEEDEGNVNVLREVVLGVVREHQAEREGCGGLGANSIAPAAENSVDNTYDAETMSSTSVLALEAKTRRCSTCRGVGVGLDVALSWSFSTPSFGIGFQSATGGDQGGATAKQMILRRTAGETATSGSARVQLTAVPITEKI
jgi:hypothetical protein